jgi:DNA-binding transcriptional LysR family regulator
LTYYERCTGIIAGVDDADAAVGQRSKTLAGTLRISTSVAFGRRILAPMLMDFMRQHPDLKIDLTCDDSFIDLVTHGVDIALRMGRLSDSSMGCRYIGHNPWVMVASPRYLADRPAPRSAADLKAHDCIVYSSVQGDAVWQLRPRTGDPQSVVVDGPLRSNNLSTLLSAARSGMGIAILPRYVASASLAAGEIVTVLEEFSLPGQELHAVFPSPKQVPRKALALIDFLIPQFKEEWWDRRSPANTVETPRRTEPLKARQSRGKPGIQVP